MASAGSRRSRVTVSVSSSPSRRLPAASGAMRSRYAASVTSCLRARSWSGSAHALSSIRATSGQSRSGTWASMFRFLCTRQRCTRARVPHTLVIALRSALPPSITNKVDRLVSSPRSTSSSSNALHTSPFSVAPSRKPSTRFVPSSLIPRATTIVVAARHPPNHPSQYCRRHCFFSARQPVDLQRNLAICLRRSHPRPLDPDLLARDCDHSSLLPMTRRRSFGRMLIPDTAQPLHFVFHHQRRKLQADGHSKTVQPLLHLSHHLGSIQRQLHRILRPGRSPPYASPCLSMNLLLIRFPHGGFPFFFPSGDYSGEGEPPLQISTTVGTTSGAHVVAVTLNQIG